ncbi:hemerythrin domain-containing protein [Paraconexibacter sp.]|uniref:hemerythrin domain-containing protein n=1 Tax=Paraconexibacter sp. TaxID=2949640 RepID=UPI003569FC33
MRRSPQLVPLSHEHHVALEAALRLRRAEATDVEDAVARFAAFWDDVGEAHFAREDDVLGAVGSDDPPLAERVRQMTAEHHEIRGLAAAVLAGTPDVTAARSLGERLNDHVRFEERELFPLIEERLAPEALERVGQALRA